MSDWGGLRVGSGQKPQGDQPLRRRGPVGSMPGGKVDEEVLSADPPEDLPEGQRAYWTRNAPRALAQGTLTPRTVEAFRLLCELEQERRETKDTIERDGRTFVKVTVDGAGQEHQELKAHPLTGAYARLCKSVESLLARFKLAPFGKAELPVKKKAAENPFANLGGKAAAGG